MTHNDVLIKFMIEYDKVPVTSSYPSLTKLEIASLLNKAYLALISQKYTGNNLRQAAFEGDFKSIVDLQELVVTTSINIVKNSNNASNVAFGELPKNRNFLYYVYSELISSNKHLPCTLITHEQAKKFYRTPYNDPWIKIPVCFIQDDSIYYVYDEHTIGDVHTANLTYIKCPEKFTVESMEDGITKFELNDQVADELINLAVIFALENVESPRLNAKSSIKSLES